MQALPAAILVFGIEAAILAGAWDEGRTWMAAVGSSAALAFGIVARIGLAAAAGGFFGLRLRGLLPACIGAVLAMSAIAWIGGMLSSWVTDAQGNGASPVTFAVRACVEGVAALAWCLVTYRCLPRCALSEC